MTKAANPQSENVKPPKRPVETPAPKSLEQAQQEAPATSLARAANGPQPGLRPNDILALQRTIGNQAVQRLLAHEKWTAESSGQKVEGSGQRTENNSPPLVQRQPFAAVRGGSLFIRPSQVNRQSDRGAARMGTAGQPIAAVRQTGRIQRVDLSQPTEVEALLTELAEAEAASGVSSGRTERVKKHLQTLKPTELGELGQALDVFEHYIEAKKDELGNVGEKTEEHAKKKLAMFKAKLLLQLVEGDIELADVQQLMGKKEAKKEKSDSEDVDLEGSDVEKLDLDEDSPVTDEIQYAAEDILDPDLEPAELSKRRAEELVQKGLFDLKAEIDKADAILPQAHLYELVQRKLNAMTANQFPQLRELGKALQGIENKIPGEHPSLSSAEGLQKLRIYKAGLLVDIFSGRKKIEEVQLMNMEQHAANVMDPEVKPAAVQKEFQKQIEEQEQKGFEEAKKAHDTDRAALKILVEAGAKKEADPVLQNTSEWLMKGQFPLYALTETHDSEGRAAAAGKSDRVAFFPNPAKGKGGIFSAPAYYSRKDNDNVIFKAKSVRGSADSDMGYISIYNPSRVIENSEAIKEVWRTLKHEVQHVADLHEKDPLSRYQSEFNAYTLGNIPSFPYDFLKGMESAKPIEKYGYTWDAYQFAIFNQLYGSESYQYFTVAWDKNENGFRDKVVAIKAPKSPNPFNSIRINNLFVALEHGPAREIAVAISLLTPPEVLHLQTEKVARKQINQLINVRYPRVIQWKALEDIVVGIKKYEPILNRVLELDLEGIYDWSRAATLEMIEEHKLDDLLSRGKSPRPSYIA